MTLYKKITNTIIGASLSNHTDNYPTPINLSYLWGFGSIAGISLLIQLFTGIFLAMHYTPEVTFAFISVEHIMRDVNGGFGLRYIHANGASMFFIVVYLHMFRGLYFGSYFQPRAELWISGVVIFLAIMATAFMGYVLPWGQMSFWGATVITNLFSAVPFIGDYIVYILWGGFSVDNPTLNRFFSLHFVVPFIIVGLVIGHLIILHIEGSNNPLGIESKMGRIPFLPYFYVKDLFGALIFCLLFSFFVVYAPNYLGHPDNYIEANPMVTPAHIVPEWYFLPFYAILRTVQDKLGGVVLMVLAIVILGFLPIIDNNYIRSTFFKPLHKIYFWFFVSVTIILGWVGQEVVEFPFITLSTIITSMYFTFFLIVLPLFNNLEKILIEEFTKSRKYYINKY
jgi:quinol-cytochrome oxidoreductase complex cytochrome b subunit